MDSQNTCRLRLLADDQIEALKRAALEVMINAGFKVGHAGARQLLKKAGAIVHGDIVKVPRDIVDTCLATAPRGWMIYDREGQEALNVYGRNSYFGTSTGAPNTMDAISGKVRPTCCDDIKLGVRLADALENIDFVMPFGSAQDIPGAAADLYEFEATISNTTKPIAFLGSSGKTLELVIEMAAAAAGSLRQLQQKPFLIAFPVHISPLVFPEKACERLLTAAAYSIPQVPSSAVQIGATGPVTAAGSVALALAEGLFCIVLAQLQNPGCPGALAANFTILDMSTSLVSIGAPSISAAYGMHTEVAQSYGLPTWGLAGATDSKAIDAQAGIEATFHLFAQALAGVNLIHDVGYVDSAMSCSPLQLMMGNEIIGMVRHYLNDIEINKDTLATDVINTVGPGGQFLTQQHTFQQLRKSFWKPSTLNRHYREQWEHNGAKTLENALRDKMIAILDSNKAKPMNQKSITEIERIKIIGEKLLLRN